MNCKHCKSNEYVKDGCVQGKQRYLCKQCNRTFTDTPARGKPDSIKAMATFLYVVGGMSFRGIAKFLGVSDVAVLKWMRAAGKAIPEPEVPADVKFVTLDEMWHFIKKKDSKNGYGEPSILLSGELYHGFLVDVMIRRRKNSSTK